jgi:uncharacterized protein YkwD
MSAVGFVHAAKVCTQLEIGLLSAAERTQRALEAASAELQKMIDILNEGRAARGMPPLDVHLTPMGERQ